MARTKTQSMWPRRVAALLLVATLLIGAGVVSAQPVSSHVLARQGRLAGALRNGMARSPTLATLVETLDASNVLVHLYDGTCEASAESCLMLESGGSSPRIVRVHFRLTSVGRHAVLERYDGLIAQIAHELQHAVEIIRSGAANQDEVMTLYRRIAIGECAKGRSDRCETEAALAVERRVLDELDSSGAP